MAEHEIEEALRITRADISTPAFSKILQLNIRRRRLRLTTLAIATTLAAGGLGTVLTDWGGTQIAVPASTTAGKPATKDKGVVKNSKAPGVEVLRAKYYTSVASLLADTEFVAYMTATSSASTGKLNGLPFTVTTMHVDRVLRGKAPEATELPLRQIGPGDISEETHIVQPGHQYLAFLGKISVKPGTTHGQWYVVGLQAGLYEVEGRTVRRTDDASPQLPTNVPLTEFDRAVLAPPTGASAP